MRIDLILEEAEENRTSNQLEAYLKNYDVLINHMDTIEVIREVNLGDIYLDSIGHKDKTMRFRNPAGHPLTVLAEYYDLVLSTTNKEFNKEFPKWAEKTGQDAAMRACLQFLKGGENDHSLAEADLKTIRALSNFDAEPVYRILEHLHRTSENKVSNRGIASEYKGIYAVDHYPYQIMYIEAYLKKYYREIAKACLTTLEKLNTPRALQSLFRMERYARYTKPEKTIRILMFNLKLSEAEIEDLKTPTYELDEDFKRIEQIGDFTISMQLLPGYRIDRKITDSEGRGYNDFPKHGLEDYKDQIKPLKTFEKMLAQELRFYRDKIENSYRSGQTWKFPDWLRLDILHPVLGYSGRRLIWQFTSESGVILCGMWAENRRVDMVADPEVIFLDAAGKPLPKMDTTWSVKLWHPVEASPEEREAWKDRVMALQIVQPFKQAFREIYTLTEPELETATYSNRFAAHILYRQQFEQVAKSRGWDTPNYYSDCVYNPSARIQGHWLTFHIDAEPGDGTNAKTGRVEFGNNEELISVPLLVFSEGMRDVDMFVSVCSIGVDPTWTPEREGYTYWTQYISGDLRDSALNRREVLQRILPALSIAGQSCIEDRWLIVEGKVRTYKIHIGSGSVHMEPGNQHLCIVPQAARRSEADSVYLPFESDGMLSLILSKAFLLAKDTQIKDRTILQQIK